jgi:hypothetical protein
MPFEAGKTKLYGSVVFILEVIETTLPVILLNCSELFCGILIELLKKELLDIFGYYIIISNIGVLIY